MDKFIEHLKELLVILTKQDFGTPLFCGILAVAFLVLYFASGTLSRIIFGVDGGLTKPFFAQLLILVVFFVAAAAALTWVHPSLVTGVSIGGVLAVGTLYGVRGMLGGKLGPAIGISVVSLGLFALVAISGGHIAKTIANKAETLKPETDPRFSK